MLAAISRVKTNRKIQPRVHVMRPAGTKRSTTRMTNVTTRRLIVERHCTALTPLGLRAVLIRAKVTQNPQSKESASATRRGTHAAWSVRAYRQCGRRKSWNCQHYAPG